MATDFLRTALKACPRTCVSIGCVLDRAAYAASRPSPPQDASFLFQDVSSGFSKRFPSVVSADFEASSLHGAPTPLGSVCDPPIATASHAYRSRTSIFDAAGRLAYPTPLGSACDQPNATALHAYQHRPSIFDTADRPATLALTCDAAVRCIFGAALGSAKLLRYSDLL